jgi:hypothetical protein
VDEKHYVQLSRRHGAGYVRHLLAGMREGSHGPEVVAVELDVSPRRVRQLYAGYLQACADKIVAEWEPGRSGGHRSKGIPEAVEALWRKMLKATPPAPYAFAASEALRRHDFAVDRATVRRWAIDNNLTHQSRRAKPRASQRRWQCSEVGALWQLDATPHAWFGGGEGNLPLLDMVDDCSRVIVGARLYPRECLLAYLDFLPRAFRESGLPLALYVDYHSFFFTHVPDNLTYLAAALHRYGVSLKYAPTPQAKGKIERQHQFWQNRLPSYFAAEEIHQIDPGNEQVDLLRLHHNEKEIHREIGMPPQEAWRRAKQEKRIVLQPFREDPWWRYVWSVRSRLRIGTDGCVPVGHHRLPFPPRVSGSIVRCQHPDGSYTFLANEPNTGGPPVVLMRYEGTGPDWTV